MKKGIWSEMHKLDFTNKLAKLNRILNNGIYARVKTGKHLSSECKFHKGLREGDATATLPFNVVLETAIRRSKVETRGAIFDKCSQIMANADDVVIMGRRLQDVEEVFTSLVEQTNEIGLEMNAKKNKFVMVSRMLYNENQYVKLGTHNFEIVKDCTYLGIILTKRKRI